MDKQQLKLLHDFTNMCKANPSVLYLPELAFYKDWLTSLGAHIPPLSPSGCGSGHGETHGHDHAEPKSKVPHTEPKAPTPPPEPESEESDIDIDNEGVIEGDADPHQDMGDMTMTEVSEEMDDLSSQKRGEAQMAMSEGRLQDALDLFTEAIKANSTNAVLYAKRAGVFIKMNKPNAAIRDCNRALELNSDSAQGYKWRGIAHRKLGHWEDCVHDLANSCKIDFDEEADRVMKEAMPRARKIQDHKREKDRKKEEKELDARKERVRKAKEEQEKARKEQEERRKRGEEDMDDDDDFAGAYGKGGAGGPGMQDLGSLLSDPELLQAFQDPEVSKAFMDISQNPANISKYQNNPKVSALIAKMSAKFGKPPGGAFGGAGGPGSNGDAESGAGASKPSSTFTSGVHEQPDID